MSPDIFPCHSTQALCSSLASEFENILSSFPLFLAICFLFHVSPLHNPLVTLSVSNHSTIQQYQFLYHSLIYHARIQIPTCFFFFLQCQTCNQSHSHSHIIIPSFKPLLALQQFTLAFGSSLPPKRTLGRLAINNPLPHLVILLLCVCVYIMFFF